MSVSLNLDPTNSITPIRTTLPVVEIPNPTLPNKIARDSYYPRYKCEDKASALFYEAGIIDLSGRVDPYFIHLIEIPLNEEERSRVKACLTKFVTVLSSLHTISVKTNAEELLTAILTPLNDQDIFPEIFNQLEIVGSAVTQCLGLSFFKRFAEHLLEMALPGKPDIIKTLMERLFTPEFEAHLNQRLEQKLADLDIRVNAFNGPNDTGKALQCLDYAIDRFLGMLISQFPPLEGQAEKARRAKLLEAVKNYLPTMTIDDPQFYYLAFRNLVFNKMAIISNEGERFAIANIGDPKEFVIDFVFVLELSRYEMFPAARIPCASLLNPMRHEDNIYPTGENWVQALLDKMFGHVRPDISKATEDDFKMLTCRKTKGEVNPVEGSEKNLLEIARKESLNIKNKTVRKILKTHPEHRNALDKIFPYFLAQLLKDAVNTHFDKDPLAAIAITLNATEVLLAHLSPTDLEIFVSEMRTYWEDNKEEHPLNTIARMFLEHHQIDSHNALVLRMPLLKLCVFLHCQAETAETGQVAVYPRKNESIPCFEVMFKGKKRNYSLILNGASPRTLLMDTLKYFQLTKNKKINQTIENLIGHLIPQNGFGGPWSTPMLNDLHFFDHDLDFFETAASSELFRQQPLFGMFLLFATQAQLGNEIPLDQVLINLPYILSKIPKHSAFVFHHLNTLLNNPEKKEAAAKLKEALEKPQALSTEQALTEIWIDILSQRSQLLPLANQCYIENIHQSISIPLDEKQRLLYRLYEQAKKIDPNYSLKLLQFIQDKSYCTPKEVLNLFASHLDRDSIPSEDISRLEKIAEHLYSSIKNDKCKEGFSELKELLQKLEPVSAKCRLLIQKMEIPTYSFAEEPRLTQADILEQHLNMLESLAETDYEFAAEELFALASGFVSIPRERTLRIIQKIIKECLAEKNLQLAQILLRHEPIQEYFLVEPESYFTLILDFTEQIMQMNLPGKENARTAILERLLKCFANNQTPFLPLPVFQRITHQILVVLNDPFYLLKPIPESFTRAFTQAFNTLFIALQVRNSHFDCLRLYQGVYQMDVNNRNVTRFASFVRDTLNVVINTPMTQDILNLIGSILKPVLKHGTKEEVSSTFKVLVVLFEKEPSFEKKIEYLRCMTSIRVLDKPSDLGFLFPAFESYSKEEPAKALQILVFFGGRIALQEFPKARAFHQYVAKLVREKQWVLACQALATDPFVWDDDSFFNKFKEYFSNTLMELLKQNRVFSISELKWIFDLIMKYSVSNPQTIAQCIEKCENIADLSLANKMWSMFTECFLKTKTEQSQITEKHVLILLSVVKLLPPNEIHNILNSKDLWYFSRTYVNKEGRFQIYKALWKIVLNLIKNSKFTERKKLIDSLEKQFKLFTIGLQLDSAQIDLGFLDLIDCYVSLNDPELLPKIVDQMAQVKLEADLPSVKDRYKQTLRNLHPQIAKAQKQNFNPDNLSTVLSRMMDLKMRPLAMARCLQHCTPFALHEVGLRIVENSVSLPYTPDEIVTLKSYKVGDFLHAIIPNLKTDSNVAICEKLLNTNSLELFLGKDELAIAVSLLTSLFFSHAMEKGKEVPEKTEKAVGYVISKIASLGKVNHEGTFAKLASLFLDIYFKRCEDKYLLHLLEQVKGLENGCESLLMLMHQLCNEFLKYMIEDCKDEARLLTFTHQVNDALIESFKRKKVFSKEELEHLKKWIQVLFSGERQVIQSEVIQFVASLENLLGNYSRDLFEIKLIQSAFLRESPDKYLNSGIKDLYTTTEAICERTYAIKTVERPETILGLYRYFSELVLPLDIIDKKKAQEAMMRMCFLMISLCKEERQDILLEELIPFWLKVIDNNTGIYCRSIVLYPGTTHKFFHESFKKKIFTMLTHVMNKTTKLDTNEFIKQTLTAFYCIFEDFVNVTRDAKFNYDRKNVLNMVKEIFDLYSEFLQRASPIMTISKHHSQTVDIYGRCLAYLLDHLDEHVVIEDTNYVAGLLSTLELLALKAPNDHLVKGIKTQGLKRMREIFRRICLKHRIHCPV